MRAYNPNGISIGSAVFAQMTAVSYWRYFDFSRCRSPISWIYKFLKYLTVGRLRGPDMAILRFFRIAAAAVLDFYNFKYLTVRRLKRANCVAVPNLVEICQTTAEIWRFFDISKMAAVRHLGFVVCVCVFGPPTKGILRSLSLCKMWLESMQ